MEDYTLKQGDPVWVRNHKDELWTARVLYSVTDKYWVYDKFAPVSWNYCKPFKSSDAKAYKAKCRAEHMSTFLYIFSIVRTMKDKQVAYALAQEMYKAYENDRFVPEFQQKVCEYYYSRGS